MPIPTRSTAHANTAVPPAAQAESTWCEVRQLESDTFRVRMSGFFGPSWLANLCCGVSRHRLSIERAHAMRAPNQSWMAELHLRTFADSGDPTEVPYLTLARAEAHAPNAVLALERFELERTDDHGGTLKLSFEAKDQLGLLASLLTQLGSFAVFPIEMHIETRAGRAADCLWLSTVAGGCPAGDVEAALRAILAEAKRA